MRRRSTALLVIVAVLVALGGGIGLGAVLFAGDGDDGDDGANGAPTSTTADGQTSPTEENGDTGLPELPATTVPEAGLDGAALELAQAINRAHQLSYHITLRSVAPAEPTEVELWRRLPRARRDTRIGTAPDQIVTSEFRDPQHGHVGCLIDISGEAQNTCLRAPGGQVDPADPVIATVDPTAGPVEASDAVVGGVPVRCFTVTVTTPGQGSAAHVACFDGEGVPAVLDGGDGRLERVGEVDRGIADDVFVIPDDLFAPSDSGSSS